jgi:uncharacterized glyoxalase superfamily protein PhnB
MHTATPNLVFRDASAAIAFYQRAFGASEVRRMPRPDGRGVWHAEIQIGDSILYLADEVPGSLVRAPSPESPGTVSIWLYVEDCEAAFRRAVEAGARVVMPLREMFWGDRFGMVVDPFGLAWAVATRVREVPPEELRRAAGTASAMPTPPASSLQ